MCFKLFINTCVVLIQHICLLCFAFAKFLYLQINKSIITASKPVCKGRTVYITLLHVCDYLPDEPCFLLLQSNFALLFPSFKIIC